MKKIALSMLVTIFVLALAGCAIFPDNGPAESTGKQGAKDAGYLPDGYYNVGDFTVFVPEGWTAIPVPDRDDPSKILTNDIQLAKNAVYNEASKTWNTENGASFYIVLLPQEDFERVPSEREYYAKDFSVTDMEDVTIGSFTWSGFSVSPIGAPVYMMWASKGDGAGGYYTSISTAYGMSLEDADLKAILGSLK